MRIASTVGSRWSTVRSHSSDISRRRCVVVAIVDLFDFHGSLMPQLGHIVGSSNPVVMVANKLDLLPAGVQVAVALGP